MADVPRPFPAEELLEHLPALRGLARALVKGDEVEDLVSDTLLRAYERPPRHRRNLRGWLTTTLRRLAVDRGRSRTSRTAREERVRASRPAAGTEPGPDEVLARSEALQQLHATLHELDEADRHLLLLRYFEGLNATEIGAREGMPPATVRTRLARALGRLRARLRDRYGADAFAPCWLLLEPLAPLAAASAGPVVALTTLTMANSTKILLGAAAVLALSLVPWFLFGPEPDGASPEQRAASTAQAADPPAAMDAAPEVVDSETSGRTPAATAAGGSEDANGVSLAVRVLDARTRQPVPDATVRWIDYSDPDLDLHSLERERSELLDDEELVKRFGESVRADSRGRAVLASIDMETVKVHAGTEDRYGLVRIQVGAFEPGQEAEVFVEPRVDLRVRVIDPQGVGLPGVMVRHLFEAADGRTFRAGARARTDEAGRAVLRNLQISLNSWTGLAGVQLVMARMGTITPVSQEVDPRALGDREVILRAPETVQLQVLLDEEFAQEFPPGWWIELRVGPDEGVVGRFDEDPANPIEKRVGRNLTEGVAVFPHVQPGFEGVLALQRIDAAPDVKYFLHPVSIAADAEGEVVVRFPTPGNRSCFRVRLLEEGATSASETTWHIEARSLIQKPPEVLHGRLRNWRDESVRLCEPPRFVAAYPERRPYRVQAYAAPEPGFLEFGAAEVDAVGEPDGSEASLALPTGESLVVKGVVVDQLDEPVPGVALRAVGTWRAATGTEQAPVMFRFESGVDGSFEIRGPAGVLKTVHAQLPGQALARFDIEHGATGVKWRLQVGPALEGVVLTDEQVSPSLIALDLVPRPDHWWNSRIRLTETGAIECFILTPGVYSLEARDSFGKLVHRSEQFELVGDQTTRPPFLQPLDLRGKLRQHEVRVVGPDGRDVDQVTLREVDSGGELTESSPLLLVSADATPRVIVDAPGFLASGPHRLTGVTRIELKAPIEVEVRLPPEVTVPSGAAPWLLRASSLDSDAAGWRLVRELPLATSMQLSLPAPGRWRLSVHPADAQGSRRRNTLQAPVGTDRSVTEMQVDVPPAGLAEPVLLPLTQEALDAASDEG